MRRLLSIVIVIAAALAMSATAGAAEQPTLLYSIASKDLRVAGSGSALTISLPTYAQLAWFTDRPARDSGFGTARALVDGWQTNGFDADPPNAALVTTSKGVAMQTIVVLRSPTVADGRVTFRARVLGKGRMMDMRTTGRPAAGRYRGELFVDSATIPPCNAGQNYIGHLFVQCYTSGQRADYQFLNDAADGTQLTYACGAGLSVRHYAPSPDHTFALQPCDTQTQVGWATRLTGHSGNSTFVGYGQNSYLGVPPGVTFTFSFDAVCGISISAASGTSTCILPAGTSTSITRPTDGNTRVAACGLNGATSLTYDSTAAGVRGRSVSVDACDSYSSFADVPTTSATVVVHTAVDLKIWTNAG